MLACIAVCIVAAFGAHCAQFKASPDSSPAESKGVFKLRDGRIIDAETNYLREWGENCMAVFFRIPEYDRGAKVR